MAKYVALPGYCTTTKKPMGVQFEKNGSDYVAVGAFSGMASGGGGANEQSGKILSGPKFKCKHCDNTHVVICHCGAILCVPSGESDITCPGCKKTYHVKMVGYDELSDHKVNESRQ